jgi:hypothetical protein
MQAAVL